MEIFSSTFFVTTLIIFLVSVVVLIINFRKKDRALKIFDKSHVIICMEDGVTIWGVLNIFKQGLEVIYNKPYHTHNNDQNSYMLYSGDINYIQIIIRNTHNLSDDQMAKRQKQIKKIINKGWIVRKIRTVTNFINRLKDAIRKAIILIIGQTYKSKKANSWSSIKKEGEQGTEQVINVIEDNLFEQMLEKYIGKFVAVDMRCTSSDEDIIELQGFLADYSNKFVAIINHDEIKGKEKIIYFEGTDIEEHGYSIKSIHDKIYITNKLDCPLVVKNMSPGVESDEIVLIKGSCVKFKKQNKIVLKIYRTKRIDFIVPRDLARIRHFIDTDKK